MDRSTPQSWTEKYCFEKLVAMVSLYGHKERVGLISVIRDGDDVCVRKTDEGNSICGMWSICLGLET